MPLGDGSKKIARLHYQQGKTLQEAIDMQIAKPNSLRSWWSEFKHTERQGKTVMVCPTCGSILKADG
jgi:hypothetical protein